MRKPEQRFWDWTRDQMGRQWFYERYESRIKPDAPDLYYTSNTTGPGWIEFKVLREWPKLPFTKVRLGNWTPGQQRWMRENMENGGKATLALWVMSTDEVFFIPQALALMSHGTLNTAEFKRICRGMTRADCSSDMILDRLGPPVV
jgi:hypothetical protein